MPEQRLASGLGRLHSAALLVRHHVLIPIMTHTGTTTRHLPIMPRRQLIIRREAVGTRITGVITRADRTELEIVAVISGTKPGVYPCFAQV